MFCQIDLRTHLFEIFVRTFEIFNAFFPFCLRIAFWTRSRPLITQSFTIKQKKNTRKDRKCYKKKIPNRRDQYEKNKSLHEKQSHYSGESFPTSEFLLNFFTFSLVDYVVLLVEVRYNEEHSAGSAFTKTVSCACTYACYYSTYLHFCCGLPNCNYVYIS